MGDLLQFVDAIDSVVVVALDLNDDSTWSLDYEGTDMSPPPLKAAWTNTLLANGEQQTAAAHANRRLVLSLDLLTSTVDGQAAELQKLWRELDKAENVLKWQPAGMSYSVFFQTFRSMDTDVQEVPGTGKYRRLRVRIDAKPYALGGEEQVAGNPLNSNTGFDTTIAPWTGQNGTVIQSAPAYSGVWSLQLTPTGGVSPVSARSELVSVTPDLPYMARMRIYSAAGYATGVSAAIDWYDLTNTFMSTTTGTVTALAAGAWQLYETVAVAPPGAAKAQIKALMAGTPAAGNVILVDEACLYGPVVMHDPAVGGGCYLDLGSVKGDVAAPLVIRHESLDPGPTLWSIRRRSSLSGMPLVLQAESMTPLGTDTSAVADAACSGGSKLRTTFATTTGLVARTASIRHPSLPTETARGRYRVLMRCKKSVAADVVTAQLLWSRVYNDAVTLDATTEWRMVDLGDVQVPMGNDPVAIGNGRTVAAVGIDVSLYLGRASGAGNVEVDYLLFLPADDRVSVVDVAAPTASGYYSVWDGVKETAYVITTAPAVDGSNSASGSAVVSSIPSGSGALYVSPSSTTNRIYLVRNMVSGTAAAGHAISGGTRVLVSYWPAYLHVRGAS